MSTAARTEQRLSLDEYLELEVRSEEKFEFVDGKLLKVSGGKGPHNIIAVNIATALKIALRSKAERYYIMGSDMKIYIPGYDRVRYADAIVLGRLPEYLDEGQYVLKNPLVIVEVLSRSTEAFDRGQKFEEYQTIPTFEEYVLVRQDMPDVLTMHREAPDLWRTRQCRALDDAIRLASIDVELSLTDIYEGLTF